MRGTHTQDKKKMKICNTKSVRDKRTQELLALELEGRFRVHEVNKEQRRHDAPSKRDHRNTVP